MTTPHLNNRRLSKGQEQPHSDNDQDEEDRVLLLSRTKSHDLNIAESTAVHASLHDDSKSVLHGDENGSETTKPQWAHSVRYLVMLCSFLTSISFGVTQVPIIYVFRLMTCDAYFKSHPPMIEDLIGNSSKAATFNSIWSYIFESSPSIVSGGVTASVTDRCSIHSIESATALSISLLGASTTVFGILNLFIAGSLIKKIGIKRTLILQIFVPAIRLFVQNVGVEVWGSTGIIIVQCSQILTILGGPSGYLLVLNTFITEVVEYESRTAALGQLAGSMMFGSALGFLFGGVAADSFSIKVPFRVTMVLFLLSSLYVALVLPYVPPTKTKAPVVSKTGVKKAHGGYSKYLGPLTIFAPQKYLNQNGTVTTNCGALLLACAVFLGILASGYLPTLLQLYSTNVFSFGTSQNGWLIFMFSLLRGVFLTFVFPKIIAVGRRYTIKKEHEHSAQEDHSERQPLLADTIDHAPTTETTITSKSKKRETFTFDLTYTRFSLIADALLTFLCSFVRKGWQMYLVAAILPFAAGTGSAAKGTILQMIGTSASSDERTDALAGISLVENMARLSTTFIFGVVFAGFTSIGRAELVFTCNAAAALLAFIVLLFARFPAETSRRLDEDDVLEYSTS